MDVLDGDIAGEIASNDIVGHKYRLHPTCRPGHETEQSFGCPAREESQLRSPSCSGSTPDCRDQRCSLG